MPASVLEEHSTFSTLLDNHSNSTYSEYNDETEYVLPLQLHSDNHSHGEHNSNTTSRPADSTAVDKKVVNNNAHSSGTGAVTTHHKAAIHKSPQQTHHNTTKTQHQHQPHNHVQFQVSDDAYSDHGDEEGVPMSAPTAGISFFFLSLLFTNFYLLNPLQFIACEHILLFLTNVLRSHFHQRRF